MAKKRRLSQKQLAAIFAKIKGQGSARKKYLSKADRYSIWYTLANKKARKQSLGTVKQIGGGYWSARIGGMKRGKTKQFLSEAAAIRAVNEHYDVALKKQQANEKRIRKEREAKAKKVRTRAKPRRKPRASRSRRK